MIQETLPFAEDTFAIIAKTWQTSLTNTASMNHVIEMDSAQYHNLIEKYMIDFPVC